MTDRNAYKTYIDFLHDPLFVQWKLAPTDENDSFWNDFLRANPVMIPVFNKASARFSDVKLNKIVLDEQSKKSLLSRIIRSTSPGRKKAMRTFYISVAASAAILVGLLVWFLQNNVSRTDQSIQITGSHLQSKDIQLITGNQTSSFAEDIMLNIDKDGKTTIRCKGHETKKNYKMKESEINTLIVPYGKRSRIVFSDGTKVWVNSGSELKFPATFTAKTRDIFLKGEIYIEVAKDTKKPFYVHTPIFCVNVHGTSFNIQSYPREQGEVVLVEGSVAIETTDRRYRRKEMMLKPGEKATYTPNNNTFEKKDVDALQYTSWKDGYILFSETPVSEALIQIGRLYNLSFNFENNLNLNNKKCTGKLVLSENIDDVLNTVAALSGTTYERKNDTIVITNKK